MLCYEGVLSNFKENLKLVIVEPQQQLNAESTVSREATSHRDTGLPTFYVKYDISVHKCAFISI